MGQAGIRKLTRKLRSRFTRRPRKLLQLARQTLRGGWRVFAARGKRKAEVRQQLAETLALGEQPKRMLRLECALCLFSAG